MTILSETLAAVRSVDAEMGRRAQALLDGKTKPVGSLGRLEELAVPRRRRARDGGAGAAREGGGGDGRATTASPRRG